MAKIQPVEIKDGKQAVYAKTRSVWRKWLQKNSQTEKSVWVILYHKKSTVTCININEATEEALCFGWIDSLAKKRDAESYYLTFTPRKAKSKWSKPCSIILAARSRFGLLHLLLALRGVKVK